MTFFEAAVEVLRRTGRPLHYKKIAEVAVRDDLLSHVGKSPDQTMSTRLTQEVKRHGESVIVETRPGVYTIREGELERLNEEAAKRQKRDEARRRLARTAQAEEEEEPEAEVAVEAAEVAETPEEPKRRRSRRRSRSNKGQSNRSQSKRSQSNRSKGRRGKSRSNKRSEDDSSTKTNGRKRARGSRRSKSTESTESTTSNKSSKSSKNSRSSKSSRSSNGGSKRRRSRSRSRSRNKSQNKSRGNRRSRNRGQQKSNGRQQKNGGQMLSASLTKHLEAGPVRLDGIAQAAYTVLQDGNSNPVNIEKLADEIFERKLVKFHTHDAAATVQAALANDNQIRRQRGHRPLFTQYDKQRWGLTEWGLPNEAVQKEQTILSLSEEIRQETLGHLGEALIDVKDEALEHIALTLMERLGYQNIKVSKRSSNGDVYFTADWRQGLADVRVCIQVTLEAEDELEADAVSALRDTLHHYSAAEGVIIHLGDISKDAVVESRQEDKAPITLIDRTTFVELLIKHGIGVQAYTTPILMVDTAFIETLKS